MLAQPSRLARVSDSTQTGKVITPSRISQTPAEIGIPQQKKLTTILSEVESSKCRSEERGTREDLS